MKEGEEERKKVVLSSGTRDHLWNPSAPVAQEDPKGAQRPPSEERLWRKME